MASIASIVQLIRTVVYGKEMRESIAQGIEAISNQQDNYENTLTSRQNTYEEGITGRQTSVETRQTNLENTFTAEIQNSTSENPSSVETVAARTDNINNKTYDTLPLRLDDFSSQLDDIVQQKSDKTTLTYTTYKQAINTKIEPNLLYNCRKSMFENGELRIAIWGDSISECADQVSIKDSYTYQLEQNIRALVKDCDVVFQNFALSGRSTVQASSSTYVATNPETNLDSNFWRSWATVGKSWRDHVKDFRPNLVIVAFGMNDASGTGVNKEKIFTDNLKSMITYMNTWTDIPSIVLVPTILPTTNGEYYTQRQDVTISVARATRAVAEELNLPVCDVNRLYTLLRDGVDPLSNYYVVEEISTISQSANQTKVWGNSFYNGVIDFDFQQTVTGANGVAWLQARKSTDLGKIDIIIYAGASDGYVTVMSGDYSYTTSHTIALPINTLHHITVRIYDRHLDILINNVVVAEIHTYENMHTGDVAIVTNANQPTYSNLRIKKIKEDIYTSILTEKELLGIYNSSEDGNGINHPTALGHKLFYIPAFSGLYEAINEPYNIDNILISKSLTTNGWIKATAPFAITTTEGNDLYYRIETKYNKYRGIAIQKPDGTYLNMRKTVTSDGYINQLQIGQFGLYHSTATQDLMWICVPTGTTPTDNYTLTKYIESPSI